MIRLTAHRPVRDRSYERRDAVALVLAVSLGAALNVIVVAVLYDAIFSEGPGLSENATQILTGWGGGIVGLLGSYIGFKAGRAPGPDVGADPGKPPDSSETTGE